MGTYSTIPVGQSMEAQAGYSLYSQDGIWGVTFTSPGYYVNYRANAISSSISPVYYARLSNSTEYETIFNISPYRIFNLGLFISNNPFSLYSYQYNTFSSPNYRMGSVDSTVVNYNGYSYCVTGAANSSGDDYYTISEYRTGLYDTVAYSNFSLLLSDIGISPYGLLPINYRLTNCTAPDGPQSASVGSTVNIPFVFTEGYGFINPSVDVYVTCNGVSVPSTYSNGVLTFTMPSPG